MVFTIYTQRPHYISIVSDQSAHISNLAPLYKVALFVGPIPFMCLIASISSLCGMEFHNTPPLLPQNKHENCVLYRSLCHAYMHLPVMLS